MLKPKIRTRRNVKIGERITPCQFCDYPISERHHALPVSVFGENEFCLQLCPNCHSLYHIVEAAFLKKSGRSKMLVRAFIDCYGEDDIRFQKACDFISKAIGIAKEHYKWNI